MAEGAEGFPCVPRPRVSAMQMSVEFEKSVVLGRREVQRTGKIERNRSMEELARQLYQEKKHEIEIAFS